MKERLKDRARQNDTYSDSRQMNVDKQAVATSCSSNDALTQATLSPPNRMEQESQGSPDVPEGSDVGLGGKKGASPKKTNSPKKGSRKRKSNLAAKQAKAKEEEKKKRGSKVT